MSTHRKTVPDLKKDIGRARAERARSLDLSQGYIFTELPETVGYLEDLEELNLRGCSITSLPSSIGNLKNLKRLVLKQCRTIDIDSEAPRGLTALPKTIGDLQNLEYLDISETLIAELPDSTGNLSRLRHLDISGTPIGKLPPSLKDARSLQTLIAREVRSPQTLLEGLTCLPALESLDLGQVGFQGPNLDVSPLRSCRRLRELTLQNVRVELPAWFGGAWPLEKLNLWVDGLSEASLQSLRPLASLRVLYLPCRELPGLPPWLGELSNLEELPLFSPRGQTLPDSICALGNLRKLEIDAARELQTLPKAIDGLAELRDLTLKACDGLARLPDSFGRLSSLERLTIAFADYYGPNRPSLKLLPVLPESFGDLANLEELTITGSRLERLPASFGRLRSLVKLDLHDNFDLTELPASFGDLQALGELTLNATNLATLPATFSRLGGLAKLSLCTAALRSLPPSFGDLPSLRTLELSGGEHFRELPASLGNLRELEHLAIGSSKALQTLPSSIGSLRKLRVLEISGVQSIVLPDSLGDLASLEILRITCCQYVRMPRSLRGMRSLIKLEIVVTPNVDLPVEWDGLSRLAEVSLNGCDNLGRLPEGLGRLTSLRKLVVSGCGIESLPDSIGDLTGLRELCLQSNQLRTLPPALGGLPALVDPELREWEGHYHPRALDVRDNPLEDPPPEVVARGTAAILAYLRTKDDIVARRLRGLVREHGEGLIGDARRCQALLFDACPEEGRCIRLVVAAQRAGVPRVLGQRAGSGDVAALVAAVADRFAALEAVVGEVPDAAERRSAARRAVACWAFALGLAPRR